MNNLERAYKEVAEELGIDRDIVKSLYSSYWEEIKKYIGSLPFKENMTEEEFNKMKTCINIPSLGKLYCTYKTYLKTNQRKKYVRSKESQANI